MAVLVEDHLGVLRVVHAALSEAELQVVGWSLSNELS